jgi:hypothetical protein
MKEDNESWTIRNQRLQNAHESKNDENYGYKKGFIPIISWSIIKKIISCFKKNK